MALKVLSNLYEKYDHYITSYGNTKYLFLIGFSTENS